MATGPEHYTEAERLRAAADEWMDADLGWKANLTAQERINLRLADLADAQVHATLALAAATAMAARVEPGMHDLDFEAWDSVAGVQEDDAPANGETFVERIDDEQFVEYRTDADGDRTATLKRYDGADIPEDEDGDETHFTRAQMDGEACTVCGGEFAVGEPTVPSAYDFIEGQLFAHTACIESEA